MIKCLWTVEICKAKIDFINCIDIEDGVNIVCTIYHGQILWLQNVISKLGGKGHSTSGVFLFNFAGRLTRANSADPDQTDQGLQCLSFRTESFEGGPLQQGKCVRILVLLQQYVWCLKISKVLR